MENVVCSDTLECLRCTDVGISLEQQIQTFSALAADTPGRQNLLERVSTYQILYKSW